MSLALALSIHNKQLPIIFSFILYQKPQKTQDNSLHPPHTLIKDYTMTHIRFGFHICTLGDGVPYGSTYEHKTLRWYP